jgi:teichuronic acid biosynthesis glycosyltransferase TuaG
MNDLVSIILPVYNIEKYIRETLDCILSQTFQYWELEITDDCSTDGTAEIIKEYANKDSRIHYWRLENNSGAGVARNNSIGKSRGRYIAFIDSDDWWYPTKLEEQLKFMQENKYEFTCTYYEDANEKLETYYMMRQPAKMSFYDMKSGCSVGTPGVIIDVLRIGKRYMPALRRAEDWGLWLEVLRCVDYLYTYPKALWKYRHISGSETSNKWKLMKAVVVMYKLVLGMNPVSAWFYCICVFLPKNILKKLRKKL